MRIITALLVPLFFCSIAKAQYNVTPGKGIDKVQLGMPVKDILSIIGKPTEIITYEAEKKAWQGFRYDVTTTLVFTIPFDHVYIFDNAANPYAIWKIYTRNDSAVIFNQSSYQSGETIAKKITINNDLRFFDDSLAVKRMFGDNFEKKIDEMNNTHVIYKDKGIFFIVNENQVRNVFLFAPKERQQAVRSSCPPEIWL
ncbi:MAG: hypothetical protein HOP10_08210 [Chitinophagaceae bacterium]|nr:hypothetical protein [Chitinophagaceae bacterium]